LIGERGREIGDAVRRLSPAARARTVIVAARADDPPLSWLEAADAATALAEGLRDQGKAVLLLVDSLTRVARAVRTVGVAAGEPTTRRGFPPSLGPVLAGLVERAANRAGGGTLSAVYAVLTETDGVDDPVAEEARALLDGHWVLARARAEAGQFPAVDPVASVSRCMADVVDAEHAAAAATVRRRLAGLARQADLHAVGAYRTGADPEADAGLAQRDALAAFLRQGPADAVTFAETRAALLALARG
ncbi:MAG: EscN/YscN/HrcN family type III secretion system ATPase, partial [Myxococcales bacterium]|nr:EscN/YscN/HrcN family type III secretion system ATPase [Myxococcales bacterium]